MEKALRTWECQILDFMVCAKTYVIASTNLPAAFQSAVFGFMIPFLGMQLNYNADAMPLAFCCVRHNEMMVS